MYRYGSNPKIDVLAMVLTQNRCTGYGSKPKIDVPGMVSILKSMYQAFKIRKINALDAIECIENPSSCNLIPKNYIDPELKVQKQNQCTGGGGVH